MSILLENHISDFKNSSPQEYTIKKRKAARLNNLETKLLENLDKDSQARNNKRSPPIDLDEIEETLTNDSDDIYLIKRRSPPNKILKTTKNKRQPNLMNNYVPTQTPNPQVKNNLYQQPSMYTTPPPQMPVYNKSFPNFSKSDYQLNVIPKTAEIIEVEDTHRKASASASQGITSSNIPNIKKVSPNSNPVTTNVVNSQPTLKDLMLNNKYKILPHIIVKESNHGNLTVPVLPSFLTEGN